MYIQKRCAATFTPTGTICSSGRSSCNAKNSDLTFICLYAEAKVQVQAQGRQIYVEFLRFVLYCGIVARNPDVNCSDNLQTEALGTCNSNL